MQPIDWKNGSYCILHTLKHSLQPRLTSKTVSFLSIAKTVYETRCDKPTRDHTTHESTALLQRLQIKYLPNPIYRKARLTKRYLRSP